MAPGPLPLPPDDLPGRPLDLEAVAAGATLWRIHAARHDARWFGPAPGAPPANRFDAPDGGFRVCYLGCTPEAAFAETFLRTPVPRLVAASVLATRCLTPLTVARPLRLARLHGAALGRLGATAEVAHGRDYACARAWSAALHAHPDAPDGLLYPSRHDDGERCVALFDRAADALGEAGGVPSLLGDARLPALLDRWRLGFDPAG